VSGADELIMSQTITRQTEAPSVSSIIAQRLRPLVQRIDVEGYYPAEILRDLGDAGAFARHTTLLGDGPAGILAAIEAMTDVGASCLSTAFCMWCQDALVWYIDRSENRALRAKYLQAVATGRALGGTGLSNPMKALAGFEPLALKGTRVAGGYRVTGRLPFVSNVEDGHLFAGIFAIENAANRYAMALFKVGEDGVNLAHNAHFIALEGTATCSVLIRDAFVPDDNVLSDDAGRFTARIRKGFVLLQAGMALGVARGAARLMRQDGPTRRFAEYLPLGPDSIEVRTSELTGRVIDHLRAVEDTDRSSFLEVLRTRLDMTWLALEAAQAAMLQFGARGYLLGAEPARRLREAQFVAIVTPSVKHITSELARG
jgi:alkylation response protein AidB-like acyl-CoA dehydrogenase